MRLRFDVFQARAASQRHLASLRSLLLPIFGGGPLLLGRERDSAPPLLLSSGEGIFFLRTGEFAELKRQLDGADAYIMLVNKRLDEAQGM